MYIDLNSDLGESFGRYTIGNDGKIVPLVTSVNAACGFHAGDPLVMMKTVRLAKEAGTALGAHPGFSCKCVESAELVENACPELIRSE